MKISNYFTEKETLISATGEKLGIKNKVSTDAHKANIIKTSYRMDAIRLIVGKPLIVNSFYRSKEVNDAVGGSKTSNHMNGLAVDIMCSSLTPKALKDKIANSGLSFDQLIEYDTFVHVGFKEKIIDERKQILKK
ncbi:MAG: D-Ala-D-Ala carboxypeptidase family metallohydrolase [Fusobacteriaceae bacterium]